MVGYSADYFERIVMPLLDLPPSARVLDVGRGNGGLTFTLAGARPARHPYLCAKTGRQT